MKSRKYTVYADFGHPIPEFNEEFSATAKIKWNRWTNELKRWDIANLGSHLLRQNEDGTLFVTIFDQNIPVNLSQTGVCLNTTNNPIVYGELESGKRKAKRSKRKRKQDDEFKNPFSSEQELADYLFGGGDDA